MRASYLEKLDGKLMQIEEEALRAAFYQEGLKNNIADLYSSLHKLIGSSGIYGLNHVSSAASTFLDWVRPMKNDPHAFSEEERYFIDLLLQNLKEAIASSEEVNSTSYVVHENVMPQLASAPVITKPPVEQIEVIRGTKGKVFVVDDDEEQAQALEFYLRQAGFDIALYVSLAEAEKALAETRPAAIVMDMMFPEGDLAGAETVNRLMQTQEQAFPVLFLSARRDIESRLAATRAGATHYFTKPVDVTRMIGELNKITRSVVHQGGKILLVDDDEDITSALAVRFEKAGFETESISHPLQILSAIEKFAPDLVLIDLHMPDCNGLELASIIRQHEVYHDLPLMFLTAESDANAKIKAMALGGDDFFSKRLDPELLVEAVKARMKRIQEFARVKKASIWSPGPA